MSEEAERRERAAFHGAGHVMLMHHFGWTFSRVTIGRKPLACPAWCHDIQPAGVAVRVYREDRRTGIFHARTEDERRSEAQKQINRNLAIVLMGGEAAEMIHDGYGYRAAELTGFIPDDVSTAAHLVGGRFFHADGTIDSRILRAIETPRLKAYDLLSKPSNWRAVEALAAKLLTVDEFDGESALALVGAARKKPRATRAPIGEAEDRPILPGNIVSFLEELEKRHGSLDQDRE